MHLFTHLEDEFIHVVSFEFMLHQALKSSLAHAFHSLTSLSAWLCPCAWIGKSVKTQGELKKSLGCFQMTTLIISIVFLLKHLPLKELHNLMFTLARIATNSPSTLCRAQISHKFVLQFLFNSIHNFFKMSPPPQEKKATRLAILQPTRKQVSI